MLRRFASLARSLGLTATRCPVCGTVMPDRSRPLCGRCALELPLRTGGYCPACGEMSGRETDPPARCAACRLEPPPWDGLYLHGRYEGALRKLIINFKFGNSHGRARLLADLGARAYGDGRERTPDLVVPVPLHTRRLLWRGFNQSLEIARGVAGALGCPLVPKALARTRNTPPQTRLGMKERQENIRGAIAARPDLVRGRNVLLVDDVYTTGSTLRECAKTLRGAGCAGVEVLVLARTQGRPD